MRDSVRAAFVAYSTPLEGCVAGCYLDCKGLVTCAIGVLVEPIQLALDLPFMHADGSPASRRDIADEWSFLRNHQELAQQGWRAAARLPRPDGWGGPLHLTPEGIDQAVSKRLDANESYLRRRFSEWDSWPADAQMLIHSVAWACGGAFRFPRFEAAAKLGRWAALDESGRALHHIEETGNPGVKPRNAAQVILGENAEAVAAQGLDYDTLYWPERAA